MTIAEIDAPAGAREIESGAAVLIDVRTPMEFGAVHADSAINIPLDQLDEKAIRAACGSKKLFFICQGGTRGAKACAIAINFGMSPTNLSGGTNAWVSAGLSVKRGQPVMSLERQVRIVAGSLVAVGSVGAFFFSPRFLVVPVFIGCGLVYSGVSDSCGMGMLLAKMPWNQRTPQLKAGKVGA